MQPARSPLKFGGKLFKQAEPLLLIVARRHFLGIVFFDEVQNLFSIETKRERTKTRKDSSPRQLTIKDDDALKALLAISNTWNIASAFGMTPDGMSCKAYRSPSITTV